MAKGGIFGVHDVPWFNGGLFADDEIIELSSSDLGILQASATLNWSFVEPAIFGTLFERNFDPDKHNLVGAHYTSKADILLIIEPVLVELLRKAWLEVKAEATTLLKAAQQAKGAAYSKIRQQAKDKLSSWVEGLSQVRVLDPACGSGNFLYLALKRMLDIWKEAYVFSAEHDLRFLSARHVSPSQLYGIEKNLYAHELASAVVWIGYLQWRKENAMGEPTEPILEQLTNIQHRDAILTHDAKGRLIEAEWPEADFIIGNPPFLGGNKIRQELSDK
jgi:type II restriction/modification system DNA methylase subunit YeeA